MSSTDPTGTAAEGPAPEPADTEAIQSEIERTRAELGETVAALADKADVKAQASAKADALKQRAPVIAGGAGLLALLVLRRRRRRRRRG